MRCRREPLAATGGGLHSSRLHSVASANMDVNPIRLDLLIRRFIIHIMKRFSSLIILIFAAAVFLNVATSFAQLQEAHKLNPVIPKLSSQSRPSVVPIYAIAVIALIGVTAVLARSAHRGARRGGRDKAQHRV